MDSERDTEDPSKIFKPYEVMIKIQKTIEVIIPNYYAFSL